jgi:L-asparaginase/Glu-tRNA(Gln) amidotransferase subunit D
MLPETALAKLMWALANCKSAEETKKAMQENLAGEMTARTTQRR